MSLLTGTRRALLRQKKVWSVQFYQENDGIGFGSGVNIDDLFAGDCTIEFYAKIPTGATNNTEIFSKTNDPRSVGWSVFYLTATGVRLEAAHATLILRLDMGVADGKRHHYAVDWDFGTLTGRGFRDGVFQNTWTAIGAYAADAAQDCLVNARNAIGTSDMAFAIGPIRLSDVRRYTGASFNPPTMNHWPENDANAQLITRMNDGAGATVTDYSGNGYSGTITFGANTRWYHGPA